MAILSEEFQKKIEDKVKDLEKKTSIEFVPYFAEQSSYYHLFRFAISIATTFLTFLCFTYFYPLRWYQDLGIAVSVGVFTAFILSYDALMRILLPEALIFLEVEEAAFKAFLDEEVFATRDRTGILIYLSQMEKAVYILADKGLQKKVPSDQWAELGRKLAEDLSKKSPGETFLIALDELSERLSEDFPPRPDDQNELKDHVRQ